MNHNRRIVLLTTGQPSTNPRIVKEVDTLIKNGYSVKVYYSFWSRWAFDMDKQILGKYGKEIFTEVGGNPFTSRLKYFISKVLYKLLVFFSRYKQTFDDYAISRTTLWLYKAAKKESADIYIAHNLGALPAAVKIAKKNNALCGFDAEDYHRGEFFDKTTTNYSRTIYVEEKYIPLCDYVTAASPLIAEAYVELAKHSISVINNVFSKSYWQKVMPTDNSNKLNIFWFSQTVGKHRGLENVLLAINQLSEYNIVLNMLGECSDEYKEELTKKAIQKNCINFLAPVSADDIFYIASQYDVGLASEVSYTDNRNYCLTNKIFTYLLAGNFILASDTLAQKKFLIENPGIGMLYKNDDIPSLVHILKKLYLDKEYLNACRRKSSEMSHDLFNWENESKKFISVISTTLSKSK